jgi:hypothetical protein
MPGNETAPMTAATGRHLARGLDAPPGLPVPAVRDRFGRRGRQVVQEHRQAVPPPPASPLSQHLAGGEARAQAISGMEPPRPAVFRPAPARERVPTLPGVGCLWAGVLASARGEVRRFAPPQECAS